MIAIVSSSAHERTALAALCESRSWASVKCESLRALKKLLRLAQPKVVLTRHKLADGYSDDVMAVLAAAKLSPTTAVIVLLGPGEASSQEARQVALGAESVHRDPVRTNVLVEYLDKYIARTKPSPAKAARSAQNQIIRFAGATFHPAERRVERAGKIIRLTPREVQLAELLFESPDQVISYTSLYHEILGTNFGGDTSTMRVLLGKLDASFRSIGLNFRSFIEVIPKTGYRFSPVRAARRPLADSSRPATAHAA